MKKSTQEKHTKIANDIMYYIYRYVDTEINLDELSNDLNISKFHMHRIFKKEFSANIYESIKDIRLQKASNLLLTNRATTITKIANLCGYSSHTSFIKAFKEKFCMTPSAWRSGEYKEYVAKILSSSLTATHSNVKFDTLDATIVKREEIKVSYIRHHGYNNSIKKSWQKLQVWIYSNDIKEYEEIGLHHDNPTITPLDKCKYIACVTTNELQKSSKLPTLIIPSGVYARFDFTGSYGDVLRFMNWVYFEWLPQSEYETTTNPPYAIYHKNHFISDDARFDISYYIPIRL